MNRKRAYGLSAAITVVLLLPALAYLDGPAFLERLRRIGWGWVAMGCAASVAYQGVRALRFGFLLDLGWSLRLTATMCFHGVARKLLPVWIGEGLGVWLFQRCHGVQFGAGTGSLVLARSVDLTIATGVLLTLLAAGYVPPAAPDWLGWALVAMIAAMACGVSGLLMAERIPRVRQDSPLRLLERSVEFLRESARAVRFGLAHRVLLPTLAASALMWLAMYVQHYSFVWALGYRLDWADVLWMQLLLMPIQLLPVRGFADAGTHEAAWIIGALAVGVGAGEAVELAIGTHLLALLAGGVQLSTGVLIGAVERPHPRATRAQSPESR